MIDELLRGWDSAYTDEDALERAMKLHRFYLAVAAREELRSMVAVECDARFWSFLALLVFTKDEKSPEVRVKPFSPLVCYQVIADWMDEKDEKARWKHPLIAIDKSRQLMLSWFAILRMYWTAIKTQHADLPILSKTEEDAKILINRLKVVHELLPPWYKTARGIMGTVFGVADIHFANGSVIDALPQKGGDAFRGRVPTMWLADEAAFQQDFEKNFTAIKGTSDARTQGIMITTPKPSFFQRIIEDTQDGNRGGKDEVYHSSTGLTIWRNKCNRADCVRIHYTADPGRRSPEWKAQAMQGMSMYQWRQEQEIDYASRGGLPVFKMVNRQVHMMEGRVWVIPIGKGKWGTEYGMQIEGIYGKDGKLEVRPVKLGRCIDHGTTNFCGALWVAIDEDDDWFAYRTYKQKGWFAPENGASIIRASHQWDEGDPLRESYEFDLVDAMTGLPDKRGKIEDIYREIQTPAGKQPLMTLEAVKKGAKSRQEGLDVIGTMLHATLAREQPNATYWDGEGYTADHVKSFAMCSALYIAPGCEALFEELDQARYDQRPGGDPLMDQPETTLAMQDELIDDARYLARAASFRIRKK